MIPTHQSGKALYYNSIKTELKSPQIKNQQQQKQEAQQTKQQQQQQEPKATKVVFSNGGVNTALHDDAEHATTLDGNGKLLENTATLKENGSVIENGNHGKAMPENNQHSNERLDVVEVKTSKPNNGTVFSNANSKESLSNHLTNGHSKSKEDNMTRINDVAINFDQRRRDSSTGSLSNCSSPTNELSSLPTPRRSLPGRYSALVSREREECLSLTSSVLTTSTPINCSPQVQRRTDEEKEVKDKNNPVGGFLF